MRAIGRESVWRGKCYGGQGNGPVMVLVREVLRPNQGLLLAGWTVRDDSWRTVQYSSVQLLQCLLPMQDPRITYISHYWAKVNH